MLPYSLGCAVVSALSGQVVTHIKGYRPVIWFAWPVMTLGFGLMVMLDNKSGPCVFISVFVRRPDVHALQGEGGIIPARGSDWHWMFVCVVFRSLPM
jgi:hypothetical protein